MKKQRKARDWKLAERIDREGPKERADLDQDVHSSCIWNSPKLETQTSINGGVAKGTAACSFIWNATQQRKARILVFYEQRG